MNSQTFGKIALAAILALSVSSALAPAAFAKDGADDRDDAVEVRHGADDAPDGIDLRGHDDGPNHQ